MKTLCTDITFRKASPNLEKFTSQAKRVYLQVNQYTKKYQNSDKIINKNEAPYIYRFLTLKKVIA